MIIPNIWKNKKCSKPPTSLDIYIYIIGPHIFEKIGSISENIFHKISENASESIWNPRFFNTCWAHELRAGTQNIDEFWSSDH